MWYLRYHTRRILRSIMRPIRPDLATKWHTRTRYLYLLIALITFSYTYYKTKDEKYESEPDLDKSKMHRYLRLQNRHENVYRVIITPGIGIQTEQYNNQEYIKDYNRRKAEYETSLKAESIKETDLNEFDKDS
ncbi:hypothetical protein QR98_0008440 [Sarcoptes scabiei]|uniref:Uncharacterized protein n=1 Tax=Sarcoptes scabiei TaxID=52283 RepID=A0A131ZWD6_SARSC|nr:hypothetical protein QR98_0008440 [Sarcoptes scabiei]